MKVPITPHHHLPLSLTKPRSNFKWVLSHANIYWFEWDFARVKTEQRLWDVIFREKPNPFFYGYRESLYRKVIVLLLNKRSGRRASMWDSNTCNQSARDWQAPVAETPEWGGKATGLGIIQITQLSSLHDSRPLCWNPQAKWGQVERAKF